MTTEHADNCLCLEDLGNEAPWQAEDSAELRDAGLVVEKQVLDHAAFLFGAQVRKALAVKLCACKVISCSSYLAVIDPH